MSGEVFNLTFHGLGPVPDEVDPEERYYWVGTEVYHDILGTLRDRDDVVITFDDGNLSDYDIAFPALCERGLRGEFFIVADRIGREGYLDEAQIREMAEAGMQIGSHGMYHQPWRSLSEAELQVELEDSRKKLEDVLGTSVTRAACPFGSYGRRVLGALRKLDYERVYTSDRGWTRSDAFLQSRNTVVGTDNLWTLTSRLTRTGISWMDRVRIALKTWR